MRVACACACSITSSGRVWRKSRLVTVYHHAFLSVTRRPFLPQTLYIHPRLHGQPLRRFAKYLARHLAMDISGISWWVYAKAMSVVGKYILKV